MGMKLFCTVSKILMCWKLGHETPTETGLTTVIQHITPMPCILRISLMVMKIEVACWVGHRHCYLFVKLCYYKTQHDKEKAKHCKERV
jgi:hypothetical protein